MPMKSKRFLTWLLVLVMALSWMPSGAFALEAAVAKQKVDVEASPAGEASSGMNSGGSDTSVNTPGGETCSYTLHLTHTLRWKGADGKGRFIQDSEDILLTEADFSGGVLPLRQFLLQRAYVHDALSAAPAPGCPEILRPEDFFDAAGGKVYGAEIRYTLNEGWTLRFQTDESYTGPSFRGQYEGAFDRVEFVPAKSITVTIRYEYSRTGGMAGMEAHTPDVIELVLDADGKADLVNWRIPHYEAGGQPFHNHSHDNLQGFRIVLEPKHLDAFLVAAPAEDATPEELAEALNRGDFNLKPDVDTSGSKYQEAWDAARTATTKDGVKFTYIAPTANGGTAATTSSDPQKQYTLCAEGLTQNTSLTVYFRRDTGSYKVRHWKANVTDPDQGNPDNWELIKENLHPGRDGAQTAAVPLDTTTATDGVQSYRVLPFSQEVIKADGSTVVNIYYVPEAIRVIFDTNYIYIPRQLVMPDRDVDLTSPKVPAALSSARPGYTFAGWQYRSSTDGELKDISTTPVDKLTLDQKFCENAKLEPSAEVEGAQVLRLYPHWEPATTKIRVTLWTEDLNGSDVEVRKTYYDFDQGGLREEEPSKKIQHQSTNGGSFTNVGTFEMDFATGGKLIKDKAAGETRELVDEIQTEIDNKLDGILGTETITGTSGEAKVKLSDFYQQMADFTILTEVVNQANGTVSETTDVTTAAPNGTTQVYVYFARKEYTLAFHYYFLPEEVNSEHNADACIFSNTEQFKNNFEWGTSTVDFSNGGNSVSLSDSIGSDGTCYKGFTNKQLLNDQIVPLRTTIAAKYGADLRDVWPGAEDISKERESTRYVLNGGGDKRRISWTPTTGLHQKLKVNSSGNVPGAYSAMSPAIVANPKDSAEVNHLVAFWMQVSENNTYRYNYCYEVPDLVKDENRWIEVPIYDGTKNNPNVGAPEKTRRNTLYWVPANDAAFQKYAFNDILTADKVGLPMGISLPEGRDGSDYYAVREYTQSGTTRYYAVSRQLVAIAALATGKQSPSARPHLTLINQVADHSTELNDGDGSNNGGYNTPDNPYDIYFYYTRDRFTVTYMTSGNAGTEEIGQIKLPYGTKLSPDISPEKYNIQLQYEEKASVHSGEWTTVKDLPVCPDRAEEGTAEWKFLGWYLSPSGTNEMNWDNAFISGNLRLYARWKTPSYTVRFLWNGGSSINTEDPAPTEQSIPANRSFTSSGRIPRLMRNGYTLTGWKVVSEGDVLAQDFTPYDFHFDAPVSKNLWVEAQWAPSGQVPITYTVKYLVSGTDTPVRDPDTYTKSFRPGTVVWESPKSPTYPQYKDYVPMKQNESVTLHAGEGVENIITFYYAPPLSYSYTVQYIDWSTKETTNHVVWTKEELTDSVSLQVSPGREDIQSLNQLGYYLVDDKGVRAASGTALWRLVELTRPGPNVASFYVLPETYTIAYRNLEVMGADADGLNNPATYQTASGAGPLKNPTKSYLVDGQTIVFRGWQMAEDTSEKGGTLDFPDGTEVSSSVTIEAGSRGNLVFRAVWSPEVYQVRFYPGDHGSLPGNAPEITYSGIPGNTVLKNHAGFSVPAAAPAQDYVFTGWKLSEDGNTYTAAQVQDMTVNGDLFFTAQYGAAPKPPVDPEPPFQPDIPVPPPSKPTPKPDPEPEPEPEVPPLIERPVDPITGMVPYDPTVILDDLIPLAAPNLNITDHFAYITGYPAGDVQPEGSITRAEVATVFFRLMLDEYRTENWATGNSFSDVSSGDWFNNAVSTCARAGIIKGYEDGTFRPHATITRAEFAAIAARFVSEDVPGYDYFTDMDGHWAQTDVARAVMAGWIKGSGRQFRPDDRLSRAETAALVNRMISRFPDKEHLLPDMIRWPDNPEDAWYYEDIQEATNSHDYDMEEFSFSEVWTVLLANRDWAALEKEWADASSASGGEVAPDLHPNE